MSKVLELQGICRSYRTGGGTLEVLKGVDFTLNSGEWCCVYGASGSGKTTLLNVAGLLEKPDAGRLRIFGEDTAEMSRRQLTQLRACRLGFVFQSYHLLPELNVLENVVLAASIAGINSRNARNYGRELLEMVGLGDRIKHRPGELSGGEQQRCAIARALVTRPELLLADEPTGNLDPETGDGILQLLANLRKIDPALAILMITHNYLIAAHSNKAVELRNGVFVPFEKLQ